MLYQIKDGTVSAGGKVILSHIDFEIHGTEKIAVVGKNGAGKTTLLNVIAGTIPLDRDDKRMGPGILCSRQHRAGCAVMKKDGCVRWLAAVAERRKKAPGRGCRTL